jgi:hypothetical protein
VESEQSDRSPIGQVGECKVLNYTNDDTLAEHLVKYRARLKSDQSPAGSDGVRQKGLGFNL